jgi:uncharacterized membrane protein
MANKNRHVVTQTSVQQVSWNFPVPPPDLLEKYRSTDPRIAEQFLDEWKSEAEHRRRCETEVLAIKQLELKLQEAEGKRDHRLDLLSLSFSFLIILSLVGVSLYLVINGTPLAAIPPFLVALGLFFFKRKKE